MDEVADFRQGLQIAKVERFKQGGKGRLKLIKVMDFANKESDENISEYINIPSKKSVICSKDDIIIARTGTLGLVLTNVEGVFHNNTFAIDYNREIFDKMFFYYYLKSPKVQQFIKVISTRTSQSDLTHREFSQLVMFIPPKEEQLNIVSILSKVDELIQRTEQIIEQTLRLKKGFMQKLLAKGIGHTKFKKVEWLFGKEIDIPEKWSIVSLNVICKNITDGKHGDCKNEDGSGYYFISAKDIFDGKIHYENARQITKSDFVEAHRRTKIESGDLVLTNSGSIGKLAIVRNMAMTPRTTFQKSVAILKPNIDKALVEFFYYYFSHNQKQLENIASGSIQKNLLLRQLESFKIVLPPLSEQNRIGFILSNVNSLMENHKEHKSTLETLKKGLMQQLLTGKIRVKL